MKISKLILIFFSIFLFNGCSKDGSANKVSFEIIKKSNLSYSEEEKIQKQYKVFETEDEWLDFIPQIERVNPYQAESLRNINFDFVNNDLIIVIGEFFNYCCSEIKINNIYKNEKEIIVDFDESGPGEATALSQAYVILKIQK